MKILLPLILLAVTACGFSPLYGQHANGGNAPAALSNVDIALIPDQSGVYLRNLLIDRFYQNGYPVSPAFRLGVVNFKETETDLDITASSEATRKQIRISLVVLLQDLQTGQTVLTRQLYAQSSYNILGSQFTTRVSESDAREAALGDLARQIEAQLALYFKR